MTPRNRYWLIVALVVILLMNFLSSNSLGYLLIGFSLGGIGEAIVRDKEAKLKPQPKIRRKRNVSLQNTSPAWITNKI